MNERQRVERLLQEEGITAREFAQNIGISAGTLSNILGGRNKPSLEVMQAILNVYRHVSADWLVLDAGPIYRGEKDGPARGDKEGGTEADTDPTLPFDMSGQHPQQGQSLSGINRTGQGVTGLNKGGQNKSVQKIVIFYTDGTFEER